MAQQVVTTATTEEPRRGAEVVSPTPDPGEGPAPETGETRPAGRAGAVVRQGWFGEWPLAAVLLGVAAGLAVLSTDHFRRGILLVALSLLGGGLLRAFLSDEAAGLLRVRRRWVDVATLWVLGALLAFLAMLVRRNSGA